MFCPYCGARLDEDARFCDRCGHTLAADTPAPISESAASTTTVDTKPRDRRTVVIVAGVVLALLIAGGVGIGIHQWLRVRATNAAADCASAVKALQDADDKVMDRLAKADELAKTPDDQVTDVKTVTALNTAIDKVDNPSKETFACPTDAKTSDLAATARDAKSTLDRRNSQLAAVDRAASAVEASKAAKSFDTAKRTLSDKVDEAKTVLADSENKVDDGAVRDALQRSIDNAEKTLANATSKNAQQVVDAVDDVSKSVDAVKQAVADHEAKLEANKCATVAGHYSITQGVDEIDLDAGCNITAGWTATYVKGTFTTNTDGSYTWKANDSDGAPFTLTWREPGSLPQWFLDSYGEYAPQMTQGKPTLELDNTNLYVRN